MQDSLLFKFKLLEMKNVNRQINEGEILKVLYQQLSCCLKWQREWSEVLLRPSMAS